MKSSLFVLFLMAVVSAWAQPASDTGYAAQTRKFIRFYRVWMRSPDTAAVSLVADTTLLAYCLPVLAKDSVDLSPGDLAEAKALLAHRPFVNWTPDLLGPTRFILSPDSTSAVFGRAGPEKGWDAFHKRYGPSLESYSFPLFFHHYTLCLFSGGTSEDYLGGGGFVALYRKEGAHWVLVKRLYTWMI